MHLHRYAGRHRADGWEQIECEPTHAVTDFSDFDQVQLLRLLASDDEFQEMMDAGPRGRHRKEEARPDS